MLSWLRLSIPSPTTSMFSVRVSISTKTGLAPTNSGALALATKEKGVVMTSSPASTPAAIMAQCSPAVPDDTPIACRRPDSLATIFSNCSSFGPRVSTPLGLLGVIFESRPDALVQIVGLAWKSGNAVLLKGGREALGTNRTLAVVIHRVLEAAYRSADEGKEVRL